MNATIQKHFDRLEAALNVLVESITSYNPSISAAINLLSADDHLTGGIDQLVIHQANQAHIESLRQTAAALDARLISTVTTLADARNALLSAPLITAPTHQREVLYTELLDYAKRISKFTVPPTSRHSVSAVPPREQIVSPMTGTNPPGEVAGRTAATVSPLDQIHEKSFGIAALPQDEVQWLDYVKQIPFVPWPTEEVIKKGALAEIQALSERGMEPSVVSEAQQGLGEGAKEVRNELSTGTRIDQYTQAEENKTMIENGAQQFQKSEEKPSVFGGLDLYDPDEEP